MYVCACVCAPGGLLRKPPLKCAQGCACIMHADLQREYVRPGGPTDRGALRMVLRTAETCVCAYTCDQRSLREAPANVRSKGCFSLKIGGKVTFP